MYIAKRDLQKFLEDKIEELFIDEGIEKCTKRYLATTYASSKSDENYLSRLCTRLNQGGRAVHPITDNYSYIVNMKDEDVKGIIFFSDKEVLMYKNNNFIPNLQETVVKMLSGAKTS